MRSDSGAFDEFFRCSFGSVVAFLVTAGFGIDESHDAAADAMAKAYEHWQDLTNPRAWVYTTAYREAVNEAKRQRTARDRASAMGWGSLSPPPDPYAAIDGYSEVVTLLSRLPPRQREVLAWRLHDFKPSEIAEHLNVDEATVRSNLRHARETLRSYFNATGRYRLRNQKRRSKSLDEEV